MLYSFIQYKDLLQLMIDSSVEESENSQQTSKRRPLTNEEITSHTVLFMLVGYETTANTLAYTSYLLALHPDIQEKLQEEIDTYFKDHPVIITSVIELYIKSLP